MRKLSIIFFALATIAILSHRIIGSLIPPLAYLEWYSFWRLFYWWEVFITLGFLSSSLGFNKNSLKEEKEPEQKCYVEGEERD